MVVSVVVDLRNISISRWGVFLIIARSRKFTLLLFSGVGLSSSTYCYSSATHLINTYKSSAPEDGHKEARNMLSNL